MYAKIFNIMNDVIYNGTAVLGSIEYDVNSLISSVLVCFMVAIPFYVVYLILKAMGGVLK